MQIRVRGNIIHLNIAYCALNKFNNNSSRTFELSAKVESNHYLTDDDITIIENTIIKQFNKTGQILGKHSNE